MSIKPILESLHRGCKKAEKVNIHLWCSHEHGICMRDGFKIRYRYSYKYHMWLYNNWNYGE